MTTAKWLGTAYAHPDDVPEERWANSMLSREAYAAMVRDRAERDRRAPAVGAVAPNFSATRLGQSSAAPFQLADTRGRPVALVFGSYT